MKKTSLTILIVLLFINVSSGQDKGVRFLDEHSWSQVKEKAKKENKYIFVDVYATWCGPCKLMDQQVYPNDAVGNLLNDKFIAIKVQQDQTKDDNAKIKAWYADAKEITEQYKISVLPSFLFFSPDGNLVHRSAGFKDTTAFKQTLNLALADPVKKLKNQLAQYNKGKMEKRFLYDLAILANNEGDRENAVLVASDYIKGLSNPFTRENLNFIIQFTKTSSDPGFAILAKNPTKVNRIVGINSAEDKIMGVIYQEELAQYEKTAKPDWGNVEKRVITKFGALGEEKVWGIMCLYYLDNKDWTNFGKYYKLYFDRAIANKRSFLHMNNISWSVVENVSDKAVLETAVKTMAYTVEKFDGNSPNSIDTYANLLYKLGRKDEAIVQEEKAMKLSNGNKEFTVTLDKMKRGEKLY